MILSLRLGKDIRRYVVTTSLVGWVQTQNQPWVHLSARQGPCDVDPPGEALTLTFLIDGKYDVLILMYW